MAKLYVAASLWGHAIDEANKGNPCCLDAETILATQEQITRLRALVAAKDEALRKVVEFSYGKCVFCREAALAGLEKE